jgi:RNA 2',3'-cyclic 3'-phosphodiesterase
MRLFVAVRVPEEIRTRAAAIGREIEGDGISLVKAENMHLTLRFIGEVQPQKADEMKAALSQITFKGFDCTVRGVGAFPSESYIRVIWAGCESGGALEELAWKINDAIGGDERFTAHLTIARVKRKADFKQFLEKHKEDNLGSFSVSGFELIESVLGGPEGPEYRTIARFGSIE